MFSRRAASSEFPNDNPELHDGLVWASDSVCGAALPTLRLRPLVGPLPRVIGPSWLVEPTDHADVAAEETTDEPAVPDELATTDVVVGGEAPWVEPEPESDVGDVTAPETSAFVVLVSALSRVALERGATRAAALLPELLDGGRPNAELPGVARLRALLASAPAWRAVLDGTSPDLAACGELPLDVWASELLSVLLDAPADREALRRALRKHGVAAFGVLLAA